jgi:hypothetical protein
MCTISREEAAWKRGAGGEKCWEERSNARNSIWKFGTGNQKRRWRARVYHERESKLVLPLHPLEKWAPCTARWELELELELELIQIQMAQKPMLRADEYARALRASQT